MKKAKFNGYTFYEDGTVLGLYGKPISPRLKGNRYEIGMQVDGKRRIFSLPRILYYAFYPFDIADKDMCVSFKDGDSLNVHLDNLYLTKRKKLIQGEGHRNRAKLTDAQIKEIRALYDGKSGRNQHDKEGYSLNDLAKKYNVSKGNIALIIRGESRNKENYVLQ